MGCGNINGCLTEVTTEVVWNKKKKILWTKPALEVDYLERQLKLEKKSLCRYWCDWQRWEHVVEDEDDEWYCGKKWAQVAQTKTRRECKDWRSEIINLWFLWYECESSTVWTYMAEWLEPISFFFKKKFTPCQLYPRWQWIRYSADP